MMAASTSRRSAAVMVTSAAMSGVRQMSSEAVMLAHGHVLGHIAAGLAEEPDGRAIHGLAQAGADEAAAALGVQAGVGEFCRNF